MSERHEAPFLRLATLGEVLLEEIDDFVSAWHRERPDTTLAAYLGMTDDEYALWLVEPDMLSHIVRARHLGEPLPEMVNDNYAELRIAARSADAAQTARLGRWLRQRGYID
ncbi:MAG TPA: hypothetical protein VNW53_13510 [Phenylobacterium sp.]|jgi:hypothetical protein|uniref:hypothetical protein n=1 Tax=Phenylobacterium sp. TaxID=1871053 RepID=UPI002CA7EA8E|nr:hypothetical protein [Phenylobacterium sp.]HXA40010.1 hypothetical protein [Phenylobacterium sp.]